VGLSSEIAVPDRLNRRRSSSRSLRLLCMLDDVPGALTPSFSRRARMNHKSLGT
jgi:hypothetical protein